MPNAISNSPVVQPVIGLNERPNREQDNAAVQRAQATPSVSPAESSAQVQPTQRVDETPPATGDVPQGRIDAYV